MAVDTQEAGLSVFELYYLFVGFVLWAATGFLGVEVVVGSLDLYMRCGSVRLCCSDLTRFSWSGGGCGKFGLVHEMRLCAALLE